MNDINTLENIFQITVLAVCLIIAVVRSVRTTSRIWILLSMFLGAFFLGDLYWVLWLLFYGETPYYSYIPSLSWNAAYIYQLLVLMHVQRKGVPRQRSAFLWIIPAVIVGLCAFYMTHGDYLANLITAVISIYSIQYSMNGLLYLRGKSGSEAKARPLYILTLVFWALEYAMWTLSMFWMGDTLANPYFWCDIALSICFIFCLPLTAKAAEI